MLGKAAIKQGWYWGGGGTPVLRGSLVHPQSLREEREGPRGAGEGPPDPTDLSELMLMKPVASAGS